ncbi:Rec8 like protein-domain-containing protein [Lipomyces oligophaga]|uniref:Rec8 like protein-domain-containing protein n=1 Tax=Lipomyces oligophaga TaxID=45792 RepID=UPI0034CD53E1
MFYSDLLLSKKGPLARIWLAANLERKLSKAHFLQTSIEKSVVAIVGEDAAPMALRLSSQLLLGVVRIYSRKAKYLLDDCNEALLKLRMTFTRGNVDLASSAVAANPQQLTLANTITDLDFILPDPSTTLGFSFEDYDTAAVEVSGAYTSNAKDITLPDLQNSIELARGVEIEDELADMVDDDLVLDTGEDLDAVDQNLADAEQEANDDLAIPMDDYADDMVPMGDESIEIGRDGNMDSRVLQDYGIDLADGLVPAANADDPSRSELHVEDLELEDVELPSLVREDTPLSPVAEDNERPTTRKRVARKLKIDESISLRSAFLRDMQTNRTGILKVYPTLPYSIDNVTLLHNYDPSGVLDMLSHPYNLNDALLGMLDFTSMGSPKNLKRKELEDERSQRESTPKRAHVEVGEEDEELLPLQSPGHDELMLVDDDYNIVDQDEIGIDLAEHLKEPDLVEDSGEVLSQQDDLTATQTINNVSRNTKEAAARYIEVFTEKQDSVDFQSLTADSTRNEAVKMFFETLVLATKDAVEVEQEHPYGIIGISSKPKLFAEWGPESGTQNVVT